MKTIKGESIIRETIFKRLIAAVVKKRMLRGPSWPNGFHTEHRNGCCKKKHCILFSQLFFLLFWLTEVYIVPKTNFVVNTLEFFINEEFYYFLKV